jgi:hypothetical protein
MAMQVLTDRFNSVQTIEYAHASVHVDILVIANETATGVDITPGRDYYIVAPDDKELHIVVQVTASNATFVTLYKEPTVTAAGTAIDHLRPNLYSNKNVITTYHTPTYTNIGTKIFEVRIPGNGVNNFQQRVGGTTRNGEEIVLPAGEGLIVTIRPEVDSTTISLANEYYEIPAGANRV